MTTDKPAGFRDKPLASSSMSSGKDTICSDSDCIAEAGDEKRFGGSVTESEGKAGRQDQTSARSSMAFNSKKSCNDDGCIGAQ
jgi:hypothetical protein